MAEIVAGHITGFDQYGYTIRTDQPPDAFQLTHRQYEEVRIELIDGRHITPEQRRKAWAIMTDIAVWQGSTKDEVYRDMKMIFRERYVDTLQQSLFRMSQMDVTTAREFINLLVDTVLEYEIPLRQPLAENTDDITHYIFQCLRTRKCAVCGKAAELHHVERVGMGRNRDDICHIGMDCLPLCRNHHDEAHHIGDALLMDKYHLESVKINTEIAQIYKLGRKNT